MVPPTLIRPRNPQLALADEILRTHLVVERLDQPRDNQRTNMGNQLAVLTLNTAWLGMDAGQKKSWLLQRLELPGAVAALESSGGVRDGELHLARLVRELVARELWIAPVLAARIISLAAMALTPRFDGEAVLSARNIWVGRGGLVRVEALPAKLAEALGPALMANLAPEKVPVGVPDAAADVYSLGVLLYSLLTGLRPVAGRSLVELMDAVRLGVAEAPSQVADAPASLDALVMKALEVLPERRFRSPVEFSRALE